MTRTKKEPRRKNSRFARLHKFDSGVLHRKKHAYAGFLLGFCYGFFLKNVNKMSTFYGLVRFTVFYVGSKSNMEPTKCQQTPNKCQHFVNIGCWHRFQREEPSISSWLPENVSASKACQKQFKSYKKAFYQTNLDFSNRTGKASVVFIGVYIYIYTSTSTSLSAWEASGMLCAFGPGLVSELYGPQAFLYKALYEVLQTWNPDFRRLGTHSSGQMIVSRMEHWISRTSR